MLYFVKKNKIRKIKLTGKNFIEKGLLGELDFSKQLSKRDRKNAWPAISQLNSLRSKVFLMRKEGKFFFCSGLSIDDTRLSRWLCNKKWLPLEERRYEPVYFTRNSGEPIAVLSIHLEIVCEDLDKSMEIMSMNGWFSFNKKYHTNLRKLSLLLSEGTVLEKGLNGSIGLLREGKYAAAVRSIDLLSKKETGLFLEVLRDYYRLYNFRLESSSLSKKLYEIMEDKR